jgi:hypothetical protein
MSRDERFGTRDLTFSRWHRYTLGDDAAMIDLDGLGYCDRCKAPLYVIEATRDVGQVKVTTVAERTAMLLNATGWLVMYRAGEECHCLSTAMVAACAHGIAGMRVRRVYPHRTPLVATTPGAFAAVIHQLRENHAAIVCAPLSELGLGGPQIGVA